MSCPDCDLLYIAGIACHERGCPSTPVECNECGSMHGGRNAAKNAALCCAPSEDYWDDNTARLNMPAPSVRPAAECRPWDDPAPEQVKAYRVYYAHASKRTADPYQDGIVIEEWHDGRFYFLEFNTEHVGTLEECEQLAREYYEREHA